MNRNAGAVVAQAADCAAAFERVSSGGRFDDATSEGPVRLVTDQELLQATAAVTRLLRLAEAERVRLAGEIARRSDVQDDSSLAKRMGATGAADLVAQVAGITRKQSSSMVRLAGAVRQREGLTGEVLPPDRSHVAVALAAGRLDPTVAAAIVRTLRKVEPGLSPSELHELERQLVHRAQEGYTADELLSHLGLVPGYAHPDGNGPTDDEHAAQAQVSKRRLDSGLTRWVLDLDPLTSGFFETALDANTSIKEFQLDLEDGARLDEQDRRPLERRRVDGVRLMAKKVLKIDDGHLAGTAVTLLVTLTEEALRTGAGTATLPGCMDTISASTARMLAAEAEAEAEIIPVVLGGRSQVLDLGTGRRFFSEAQRRAMALRDGGCAGPCCDAPLSWCDAAHIVPAGRGRTSLDNGLLLCWRCHRLLDDHGWQVQREDSRWWWTPPPWVDPGGTQRPGGRIPPEDLNA